VWVLVEHAKREAPCPGHRMRGFDGGHDALAAGQIGEGLHCLGVSYRLIVRTASGGQPCVFRTHTGIVQSGTDRVRFDGLSVGVLQHVGTSAVQHANAAPRDGRGVPSGGHALTACLEAV